MNNIRRSSIFFTPVFFGFFCIYLFIAAVFFLSQMKEAYEWPFWLDEQFSLDSTIRSHGYTDLLLNGAKGQGSSAPLDYIICKALDQMKEKVSYVGVPPNVYFRLFANSVTVFSVLMAAIFLGGEIAKNKKTLPLTATQLFLLLCVPVSFLFSIQVYKYAHEMRPYALWVSIYLLSLAAGLLSAKNNRVFFWTLIFLSLSATASLFQLGAMAIAYFIVHLTSKEKLNQTLISCLKLFGLPLAVVFYYCLRSGEWGYGAAFGTWGDFVKLWSHKMVTIPLMAGISALCFAKLESRKYALAPLSFLFAYLMGPAIFWITKWRGFLYADRQYIYYELTNAVFLMTLLRLLPVYVKNLKPRVAVATILVGALFAGGALAFRPKIIRRFQTSCANVASVLKGDFV